MQQDDVGAGSAAAEGVLPAPISASLVVVKAAILGMPAKHGCINTQYIEFSQFELVKTAYFSPTTLAPHPINIDQYCWIDRDGPA